MSSRWDETGTAALAAPARVLGGGSCGVYATSVARRVVLTLSSTFLSDGWPLRREPA